MTGSIVGVDTAYRRTGWAALGVSMTPKLIGYGAIRSTGSTRGEQLVSIEHQFAAVLRSCRPELVIIERPGRWMQRTGSSRDSVELMAMARGTLLKNCAQSAITTVEVDFYEVRGKVLGRGNAGEDEVIDFLREIGFDLPVNRVGRIDDDVADSIMLALYGITLTDA